MKLRLYGITNVKLKITKENLLSSVRLARRVLGRKAALRVDANMSWSVAEALANVRALSQFGIHCVEQPWEGAALEGHARLVRETEAEIIVDEGFTDRASLQRLLQRQACSGINVRISKCGGLVAARRRCEEARRAGLVLQIGCQVGESSLLSAAQRILITAVREAKYLEGCYGKHLLREDPVFPNLQLGYGGRLPGLPESPGLGVTVDEAKLNRWVSKRALVSRGHQKHQTGKESYVPAR
jgi:L-alanine-DL-glutamate epimerase-like enolase superfamily enzyme